MVKKQNVGNLSPKGNKINKNMVFFSKRELKYIFLIKPIFLQTKKSVILPGYSYFNMVSNYFTIKFGTTS